MGAVNRAIETIIGDVLDRVKANTQGILETLAQGIQLYDIKEISILAHMYACVASGKVLSPIVGSALNEQITRVASDAPHQAGRLDHGPPSDICHVALHLISLDLWTA